MKEKEGGREEERKEKEREKTLFFYIKVRFQWQIFSLRRNLNLL